jgi:hypothetical protein
MHHKKQYQQKARNPKRLLPFAFVSKITLFIRLGYSLNDVGG